MTETFMDYFNKKYVTEVELAKMLDVSPERMRDLRSLHANGKQKFIDFVKPSSKLVLYERVNVINWLDDINSISFGSAKEDPDE